MEGRRGEGRRRGGEGRGGGDGRKGEGGEGMGVRFFFSADLATLPTGSGAELRPKTNLAHFYPRDAMLARVFATATCPSVRLLSIGGGYMQNKTFYVHGIAAGSRRL